MSGLVDWLMERLTAIYLLTTAIYTAVTISYFLEGKYLVSVIWAVGSGLWAVATIWRLVR